MSRNALVIDAGPEAVWAVLADAFRYQDWVVGLARSASPTGTGPRPVRPSGTGSAWSGH